FPAPRLINSDDKERLEIEFINGDELKKVLEKSGDYLNLSEEIGRKVAILHSNSIIHSDLTTSNMILKKEIYFIDFGLSFFSHKIEDMAVDLHLLNEALKSKHYKIWEECFRYILQGYKKESKRYTEVINRIHAVEKRGRYKQRY
ncbi:MAG: KEOPS complex kinase/ATPase Bud32, partial [Nanoarchaeota archaeon]